MTDAAVFIDTAYLIALINRRDALHSQAKALAHAWSKNVRALLTSDAVLIEFANFFARSPLRILAATTLRKIQTAPGWTIERLSTSLIERAEARYGAHAGRHWSLTDCVSMEVMLNHGSTEAATPDRHFRQAGFRPLMSVRSR
jgi:uncharacterized protein